MEWLVIPVAILALYWLGEWRKQIKSGALEFWKIVRDRPVDAAAFFRTSPHWYVGKKPAGIKTWGPYKYLDPFLGRMEKVYADQRYEAETQADFVSKMKRAQGPRGA